MRTLDLNGRWSGRINYGLRGPRNVDLVTNLSDKRTLTFNVPGEIHMDLMQAGLLEDVYVGTNILKARWVEECMFYYTKKVDIDFETGEKVFIELHNLDYNAEVYINKQKAGEHNNYFYPFICDITQYVRKGENIITVVLSSGLFEVSEKPIKKYHFMPEQFEHLLHKRNWLRKPQFQFGWDWCERLINVGMQGNASIKIVKSVLITGVQVLASLSDCYKHGKVTVKAFAEGNKNVTLTAELCGKKYTSQAEAKEGVVQLDIAVDSPDLWYPKGAGAQPLYDVVVGVCAGEEILLQQTIKTAFRHVEIDTSKNLDGSSNFTIMINGKRIFAKGANIVPADMILSSIDEERYDRLVEYALDLNFNLLRVWGGGLYESDYFYQLCDKHGILVWQEFIFACINYPNDREFVENVRNEAIYQVRRLSNHPSLIMWCGNNEIESFKFNYNLETNDDDRVIFDELLPQIIRENDNRIYWKSSPYTAEGIDPHQTNAGDQHPWEIGFDKVDYRNYRVLDCSFANEGGLNGAASYITAKEIFAGREPEIHTPEFIIHDNFIDLIEVNGKAACNNIVYENLGIDPLNIPYKMFVFLSSFLQGEALKEYIENFRTRQFKSSAAVYWMFNDCWPTVRSWTVFDYYFRKNNAYYKVKKAFSSLICAYRAEGGIYRLYLLNDNGIESANGLRNFFEVEYGVCSLTKGYIHKVNREVVLTDSPCVCIADISFDMINDENDEFPYVILRKNGNVISTNRYFIPQLKHMKFKDAQITETTYGSYKTLKSSHFVAGVCLDIDGEKKLCDNAFDLFPDVEVRVNIDDNIIYTLNDVLKS